MDPIQQAFVIESTELLQQMEDHLLQLETDGSNAETINSIFRAAHTIKGSAGVIECTYVVEFTHVLENLLDRMREGLIAPCSELIELLLASADHLRRLVGCVEKQELPDASLDEAGLALHSRLQQVLGQQPPAVPEQRAAAREVIQVGGGEMESDHWHISLRFGRDVLRKGMDPANFLRYLAELGEIISLTTLPDALPDAADMDPESCYLGFEISYRTDADKARIESVFDFVRDDCIVHIWPHQCLAPDQADHLPETLTWRIRMRRASVRVTSRPPISYWKRMVFAWRVRMWSIKGTAR